jgi:glycine cleavage system aminomethyltransferase T
VQRVQQRYLADVAVSTLSEGAAQPLTAVLRQAGAVFARRGGTDVAVDYGSAGGELAVCVSAVGLVNRAALTDAEHELLRRSHAGVQLGEWTAIELLGPHTTDVLRALGVLVESDHPISLVPFADAPIGPVPARWLLKSDHRALALVPAHDAAAAWSFIEQSGRPFGISCVGSDAASRYELIERTRRS